jgi:hypothetical protein
VKNDRLKLLPYLLALTAWFAAVPPARAQGTTQLQDSAQKQSTAAPSQSQAQPQAAHQVDSLADAARRAKEKRAKSAAGKVYTEEDLSGLSGRGVSVVGQDDAGRAGAEEGAPPVAQSNGNDAAQSAKKEEAYWRGRARRLLDQMTATDQQIAAVKEEIRKYGNGGFDPSTGLGKNVIYVDDRQSQLTRLEKQRADLDKQMDQLQEEGRKAGAPPSWFR